MSFYLDASVIVPAIVREAKSGAVERLFQLASEPMIISNLAAGEFASAIARRTRMGLHSAQEAQALFAEFDQWPGDFVGLFEIAPDDIADATRLVRAVVHGLRLPDAIHLAVCQRRQFTLATLDDGLADAARALGVAHICPV